MVKIYRASKKDIPIIEDILLDVVLWLDGIRQPLWQREQVKWERLKMDFLPSDFYIACLEGVPAGCMALIDHDPVFWPNIAKGHSLFIHKLAVKRNAAGTGVSTALIDYAKHQCHKRGIAHVRLDCDSKNEKVCAMYERNGFIRVDIRCLYGQYFTAFYVCDV